MGNFREQFNVILCRVGSYSKNIDICPVGKTVHKINAKNMYAIVQTQVGFQKTISGSQIWAWSIAELIQVMILINTQLWKIHVFCHWIIMYIVWSRVFSDGWNWGSGIIGQKQMLWMRYIEYATRKEVRITHFMQVCGPRCYGYGV